MSHGAGWLHKRRVYCLFQAAVYWTAPTIFTLFFSAPFIHATSTQHLFKRLCTVWSFLCIVDFIWRRPRAMRKTYTDATNEIYHKSKTIEGGKKGFLCWSPGKWKTIPDGNGEAHGCSPALFAPVCLSPVSAEDEATGDHPHFESTALLRGRACLKRCALPFFATSSLESGRTEMQLVDGALLWPSPNYHRRRLRSE